MYENEIYSGSHTGDHTTGVYQSYQTGSGNGGNMPPEPGKRNIPADSPGSCCFVPAWDFASDCSEGWAFTPYSRSAAWIPIPGR